MIENECWCVDASWRLSEPPFISPQLYSCCRCPSSCLLLRYIDAARCFNTVLAYINRTKQYHARSVQYDQVRTASDLIRSYDWVSRGGTWQPFLVLAASFSPTCFSMFLESNVSMNCRHLLFCFHLLLQILKKNEQMYAMLACVVALCPAAQKLLDENVATQVCIC
jgi:hypothetical protein